MKTEPDDIDAYFGTIRWQMISPTWTEDLLIEGFEPNMVEWKIDKDPYKDDRYTLSFSRGDVQTGSKDYILALLEMALQHYLEDLKVLEDTYRTSFVEEGIEVKQPYLMIQMKAGEIRIKPSVILDSPATNYRKKILMFVDDLDTSKVWFQYRKGQDLMQTTSVKEALHNLKAGETT